MDLLGLSKISPEKKKRSQIFVSSLLRHHRPKTHTSSQQQPQSALAQKY
jgi:hypothetical protein